MKEIQAIFLDRDGTIGGEDEVIFPKEFTLYPNSNIAIKQLLDLNISLFSFTNQPDISRGLVKIEEFEEELLNFGFKDTFICPHIPEMLCSCRKPKEGMLLTAKDRHNLDLTKTIVIGDRYTDMIAAKKVGARKILVLTGCGEESLKNNLWDSSICDYIAKDLLDAVNWIKSQI